MQHHQPPAPQAAQSQSGSAVATSEFASATHGHTVIPQPPAQHARFCHIPGCRRTVSPRCTSEACAEHCTDAACPRHAQQVPPPSVARPPSTCRHATASGCGHCVSNSDRGQGAMTGGPQPPGCMLSEAGRDSRLQHLFDVNDAMRNLASQISADAQRMLPEDRARLPMPYQDCLRDVEQIMSMPGEAGAP